MSPEQLPAYNNVQFLDAAVEDILAHWHAAHARFFWRCSAASSSSIRGS